VEQVPKVCHEIASEGKNAGGPRAVVARQIVRERGEDHDNGHKSKHFLIAHGPISAKRITLRAMNAPTRERLL
jgi:hypothetical protein